MVAEEAQIKQEEHREISAHEGLIEAFAERQIPADWQRWSIDRRRDFWAGATHTMGGKEIELVERDRIAAVEVWCELFNGNFKDLKKSDTREINAILAKLKGWKRAVSPIRVGPYNAQRGFIKNK
jgi:hypothetical protein